MSVLTNLLRCYEYCENEGLVDVHNGDTVLLPVYHQSIPAGKNNILILTLDEKGNLLSANFEVYGKVRIFPITEDSVARTSNIAPHPLEDKMQYCILKIADNKKFEAYKKEFDKFYNYVVNHKVKLFLDSIRTFLLNEKNYEMILSKLPFRDIVEKEKGKIEYIGEKGKKKKHDFKDTFLCFEVKCNNGKYLKVDTFKELHEEFIRYIDEIAKLERDQKTRDGNSDQRCNISGNNETITDKHRGLMGTAKVISVSNNKETYFGRFNVDTDIISVGRKSSEKIHLMLKFLLENKNSHTNLAGELYLINWFSGDIKNSIEFDLTDNETDDDDYMEDDKQSPVSEKNQLINRAFTRGAKRLNRKDEYYLMLIDKSSDGRISIRYYKEMPNSQLVDNLEAWQKKCIWENKNFEKNLYYPWVPTLKKILLAAYGIEKDKKVYGIERVRELIMSDKGKKENKEGFSKTQFQKLVIALLEGRSVPSNIKNALAQNIRNRQRYDKTWNDVLTVSLAILSEGKKEDNKMREKDCQTRSYLFGRLLSVYDKLENDVLRDKNKKKGSDKSSDIRATNAERYWNAFVNKPDTTMGTLERSTKYCVEYMKSNGLNGFLKKIEEAKGEILELLDTEENRKYKTNTQLDNDFIFGYYAQRKEFFTKKEKEVKEEDNE